MLLLAGNAVTSVTSNAVGSGYKVGDTITVAAASITGATADLVVTLAAADMAVNANAVSSVTVTTVSYTHLTLPTKRIV